MPEASLPRDNPGEAEQGGVDVEEARARVAGPAIGLIVVAGIDILIGLLGLLGNLLHVGMGASQGAAGGQAAAIQMLSGVVGLVMYLVVLIVAVVILIGALKMRRLESHGFAVASAILALIPCISCCFLAGIPIGIWALVVLLKPEVKDAFTK